MLEDRAGLGSEALVKAAKSLVAAANNDPDFAGSFTLFNAGSPSVYADIDRESKRRKLGLLRPMFSPRCKSTWARST